MLAIWAHWMHGADQRLTAKAKFVQYVKTVHLQHDRVLNPGQQHPGFGSLNEQREVDMLQYIAAVRR